MLELPRNVKNQDSGNRPFELKFRLPKLRKWRIISQRYEIGRIIHSKVLADYLKDETQRHASMVEYIYENVCLY